MYYNILLDFRFSSRVCDQMSTFMSAKYT